MPRAIKAFGQFRLLLVCVAFLALALIEVAPARATSPTIESPTPDQVLSVGSVGPLQIRWNDTGDYLLSVTGQGYNWQTAATSEAANVGNSYQFAFDPLPGAGTYTATVQRSDGTDSASVSFMSVGQNTAVIVTPGAGSIQLAGFAGPLRVRFDSVRWPEAIFELRLNASTVCSWAAIDVEGTTQSCPVSSLGPGNYALEVIDTDNGETVTTSTFTVTPHLAILSSSAWPLNFYPLVVDGYRDTTRFRFSSNQAARTIVRVRNKTGHVVRRISLGRLQSGSWRWNGRSNAGSKVAPGYYRISFTARTAFETRTSSSERVQVKTALRTYYGGKSFCGACGPGTIEASAGCYIDLAYWSDDDAYLDCWGGNYARSNYIFAIPASTFRLSFGVSGAQHCCYEGAFSRTGTRLSPTRFRVRIQIGGWRAYDIRRVRINYAYQKRI
jgi:hypothetical protein